MMDDSVGAYENYILGQVEFQLRGFLLGEKIESKTIQYPDEEINPADIPF